MELNSTGSTRCSKRLQSQSFIKCVATNVSIPQKQIGRLSIAACLSVVAGTWLWRGKQESDYDGFTWNVLRAPAVFLHLEFKHEIDKNNVWQLPSVNCWADYNDVFKLLKQMLDFSSCLFSLLFKMSSYLNFLKEYVSICLPFTPNHKCSHFFLSLVPSALIHCDVCIFSLSLSLLLFAS